MEKKGTRFQRQSASNTIGFPRGGAYFVDQLRDIDFTNRAAGKALIRDGAKYVFGTAGGVVHGNGSPEGVVVAADSVYCDDITGLFYVNPTSGSNTGRQIIQTQPA